MSEQEKTGPLRRIAAIVGVAGAVGAGVYGVSVVAASAQTPGTTTPPTTVAPSSPRPPSNDDPNCPNMGGSNSHGTGPSAPTSYPDPGASV